MNLAEKIRTIPDFPTPGILFRDITPLLADRRALGEAIDEMSRPWRNLDIDLVASVEARGFIFSSAMAIQLGAGFVPVRKAGKLPYLTRSVEYTLEYRSDVLHVHEDAVSPGQRVLIVDDLLATGGTAGAATELIEGLGAEVVGMSFLVELTGLGGRAHLAGRRITSVLQF